MILNILFPDLYDVNDVTNFISKSAVASLNYENNYNVKKSHINDNCVIICGIKPVEWFIELMVNKGYPTSAIDNFTLHYNTDNSISVIETIK